MKNIVFIFLFFIPAIAFSQVNIGELGFNYSALVRDTAGRVQPSKPVKLRFTLLMGQNGNVANSPWVETQNVTTDAFGFVNVSIGNGTKAGGTSPTFKDVDYTIANYWILIEVWNNFTSTYDPLAKQAFQAVPYAKVAGALAGGSAVPPGTIVAFGGDLNHVPQGWLICDGRELDNTDPKYKPLFNAIQYNWGTSNHANRFNVPFTLGMFLRGANTNSGYDPNASTRTPIHPGGNAGDNVGSYQSDMVGPHNHPVSYDTRSYMNNDMNSNSVDGGGGVIYGRSSLNISVLNNSGVETRPKNVYVNYIIKL